MKNLKFIFITVIALAMLLFAGCKSNADPETTPAPEAPSADPAEPSAKPEPTAEPDVKNATISVEIASDELLGQYSTFEEFSEFDESEEQQRIIFTTDTPVKDFKFISVEFEEIDQNIVYKPGEELFAAKEFSPESPVVVAWTEVGLIPNRGISYVDSDGITRYFTILQSGEDGSVLIDEFYSLRV